MSEKPSSHYNSQPPAYQAGGGGDQRGAQHNSQHRYQHLPSGSHGGGPFPQQMQQHGQHGQSYGAVYDPVRAGMDYQASLMAQCANGNHQIKTDYGIAGIIIAVCCFPCGLVALCVDREKTCTRCGQRF